MAGDIPVIYGMIRTCPTAIILMFEILLAEAIAATVVPNLTAMDDNVSPFLMVYFFLLVVDVDEEPLPLPAPEPDPLSCGIATEIGRASVRERV